METLEPSFAHHPDFPAMLLRLREELELGDRHRAGMAFAILEIDDTAPEGEDLQERLLARALVAAQRTLRQQRSLTRRIADFVIRIDHFLFVSLGSVNAGTLRVPLGRLVHELRQELYATPDIHALRLRRQLSMGVAHWLPEVGFLTEQMMFTKAWQAYAQAKATGGIEDPSGFLGLSASNLDTMRLVVYDWGQTQGAPKAPTGELAAKKSWRLWK